MHHLKKGFHPQRHGKIDLNLFRHPYDQRFIVSFSNVDTTTTLVLRHLVFSDRVSFMH